MWTRRRFEHGGQRLLRGSTPLLFVLEKELIGNQACFENSAGPEMGLGFETSFLRLGFGAKSAEGDSKRQMFKLEVRIGIGAEPGC